MPLNAAAILDTWPLQAQARYMLTKDEGYRDRPYKDTKGFITIGVGRNLEAKPLSPFAIKVLLDEDINEAREGCIEVFGAAEFDGFPVNRQLALLNLVFNLGIGKFKTFKETIALMKAGKWNEAADRLLTLPYAQQVKSRAERVAKMLKDEDFPY